jgi:hypothetical protein
MNRVIALLSLVIVPTIIFAQTSGKLSGVVTSADGTPLIGANVVIEGTTLGAVSDEDGQYFIINIPEGIYTVSASFIGYESYAVNNVRVSVGLTTNLDFNLEDGEGMLYIEIINPVSDSAWAESEEVYYEEVEPESYPFIVDSLLEEMEFGTIAFNAPTNINIDDSPEIQLLLSLAETVEQLKQSITEEGEIIGANIRVNNRMEAYLSGYMFQITAITPEIQAVSKNQ